MFFNANLVYELIQNFSNSKNILSKIIKIDLLQHQLQENYFFYSKKLKFIIEEKKILLKNIKKLKQIHLKKKFLQKKQNIRTFYKIHCFTIKTWKSFKKLKQHFRMTRDLLISEKNLEEFFSSKTKLIDKNKNISFDYILGQLKQISQFNYWLLNVNNTQTFCLLKRKFLSNFKQNICSINGEGKNKNNLNIFDKKSFLLESIKSKLICYTSEKNPKKKIELKKNLTIGARLFFFYIKFFEIVVLSRGKSYLITKRKINTCSFYFTLSLVFLLSDHKKKRRFNLNKKNCENDRITYFFQTKIRGNFMKIFKPLDSKHRTVLNDNFILDQPFFLVDTTDTAQKCLKILKKNKYITASFYPIKPEQKGKPRQKILFKNKELFKVNFDFDKYDYFVSDLILKMLFYQLLNLKVSSYDKYISDFSTNLKNEIGKSKFENQKKLSFSSYIKTPNKTGKLKMVIKNSFHIVSTKFNELIFTKKHINNTQFFFKIFFKFLNFVKIQKRDIFFKSKSKSLPVWKKSIFFFKNRNIILTKISEYLKLKNKLLEKIFGEKIIITLKKKLIFDRTVNSVKTFSNSNSLVPNNTLLPNFLFFSLKKYQSAYFLLKKNLKVRLRTSFFKLEFPHFVFFLDVIFKKKQFKISKLPIFFENLIVVQVRKLKEIKAGIKSKKYISKKAENIIQFKLENFFCFNSFFLEGSSKFFRPFPSDGNVSNLFDIRKFFECLQNINDKITNFKSNYLLKKSETNKAQILPVKGLVCSKQFIFLYQRFKEIKKRMLINRKNYFIISQKKRKIKIFKENNFLNYFEDWSKLARIIYKNLSSNYLNPLGGTIFFDYVPNQIQKKGQILFSIVPPSKTTKSIEYLSDGELTLISLSIFIAFNYINGTPLIILDEIDCHLDPLNLEKFFGLFKKLEKKKGWNTIIVTQRSNLDFYFSEMVGIYKSNRGSMIHLIKF